MLLTFSHIFSITKRINNIIHSSKHKQNPEKDHQIWTNEGEITIAIAIEIGAIEISEIAIAIGAIAIGAIAIGAIAIDADRRCVGDHAVVFGMLADHADRRGANDHADRSLPLSLAECVLFAWVFSFCGSLYLLRVLRKMFEGKTIL